ncbi:MAG TPA: MoxR family ATPase [Anaeromyxobacteraceae bacterium]|nr:MoxR family ATPase [Anaeromyxobacteraceae bacterium]
MALRNTIEEQAASEWQGVKEIIAAASEEGVHVLLYGVPGTGKTTAAWTLAQDTNREYTSITMHGDLSAQELVGHFVPVGNQTWEFRMGPLAKAFTGGHVCSLNELDHAAGPVNTALYAVLDDPQVARLTVPTGIIARHDKFLAIGTTNTKLENLDLPEALLDRFPIRIPIVFPNPQAVERIQAPAIRRMVWEVYSPRHPLNGRVTYRLLAAIDKLKSRGVSIERAVKAVFPDEYVAREIGTALALAS